MRVVVGQGREWGDSSSSVAFRKARRWLGRRREVGGWMTRRDRGVELRLLTIVRV